MWWVILFILSPEEIDFKTETVAVCDGRYCEDKLLVTCGEDTYFGEMPIECGEIYLDMGPVTGYAFMREEWIDPRT